MFERYRFVKAHAGWTYHDYDAAAKADIELEEEFAKVEAALVETAQAKAK